MTERYREIIRRHCRPLDPIPTGQRPVLRRLPGLRAVLFDIYGTLFISASGEVGTDAAQGSAEAFASALAAVGIAWDGDPRQGVECLLETIHAEHEAARRQGVDCPEVDIAQIWKDTLLQLNRLGKVSGDAWSVDPKELATQYEARTNPVWPMPHVRQCLEGLQTAGLALGIISNAQFFTIELFPALLGEPADALGFDPQLQYYSYRQGRAKPGAYLYELAQRALASRGIKTKETLYVGNDMLNDILPANRLGYRTALFAGDWRSLRRREDDPRVEHVAPDLVLSDLLDLVGCVSLSKPQE